jgi:hypothetical protein
MWGRGPAQREQIYIKKKVESGACLKPGPGPGEADRRSRRSGSKGDREARACAETWAAGRMFVRSRAQIRLKKAALKMMKSGLFKGQ